MNADYWPLWHQVDEYQWQRWLSKSLPWIYSWRSDFTGPLWISRQPWLLMRWNKRETTTWLHLWSAWLWCAGNKCPYPWAAWDHNVHVNYWLDDGNQIWNHLQQNRCSAGRASDSTRWQKTIPVWFGWQMPPDSVMGNRWCVEAVRRLSRSGLARFQYSFWWGRWGGEWYLSWAWNLHKNSDWLRFGQRHRQQPASPSRPSCWKSLQRGKLTGRLHYSWWVPPLQRMPRTRRSVQLLCVERCWCWWRSCWWW